MSRKLFSQDDLSRIYASAVRVLGQMGMKVENRECLETLEQCGAKIDYPAPNHSGDFLRELHKITDRAKEELS